MMRRSDLVFIVLIIAVMAAGCNNKWKTYVVKAGQHSAGDVGKPLTGVDRIEFEFKANDSWYYQPPESAGWNKIRGFSHGHHQDNSSARFGYQCFDDTTLVVGGYCYADGVSPQEDPSLKGIIDTIQPGQIYHCFISRVDSMYLFEINGRQWHCRAGQDLDWGYLLNPYIGGEFTLDHDWSVEIRDIKQE